MIRDVVTATMQRDAQVAELSVENDKLRALIRKRVRSATLLGAGGLVPDVVGDGRGRHGEARFAGGGRSYD
jgi:hypothetical protein